MIKYIKKTPEYLQSIAAIWLILVALTIFAEVTFRNLGIFLGADQIVQNSVPAIVFLQVPFAIASGTMLRTTMVKVVGLRVVVVVEPDQLVPMVLVGKVVVVMVHVLMDKMQNMVQNTQVVVVVVSVKVPEISVVMVAQV